MSPVEIIILLGIAGAAAAAAALGGEPEREPVRVRTDERRGR